MKNVHEIEIKVEGKEWEDAITKSFNKNVQNVKVDGFRKGKVPRNIFEKKFGKERLYNDAINFVLQEKYATVIKDSKLIPIIQPTIDIKEIDDEKLVLTFRITTKPEVKVEKYTKLGVKKGEVKVTEEEVKSRINSLLEQYADIVIKDGKIENGDTAVIDFEGFKDGVAFDGGKGENYPLELGSGSFIPGFEDQVVGMKVGETKDINVKFPEEYQAKDLAGADATFKVTVHEIKSKVLPELDDELAKDVNIDGVEDLEALKKHIKEQLKSSKEAEAEEAFNEEIIDKLIENTPFEVPDAMVETEVQNIISEINANLQQQGLTLELYQQMTGQTMDQLKADVRDNAEKRVKYQLIVAEIVKAENIEVSDEELAEEIKNIATYYGREEEEVKKIFAGQEDRIKEDVASRKAVDLVKENVAK